MSRVARTMVVDVQTSREQAVGAYLLTGHGLTVPSILGRPHSRQDWLRLHHSHPALRSHILYHP